MAWDKDTPLAVKKLRMMSKSPDGLYQELIDYGAHCLENHHFFSDEEIELALLKRPDRLVRLGLAQYGLSKKVGQALYKDACTPNGDAEYKQAIRLAVLGNPRFPIRDFGSYDGFGALTQEQLAAVVKTAEINDLFTLVTNPGARALLSRLFLRKPPFDTADNEPFLRMLVFAARDPALTVQEDSHDAPDFLSWDLQKGLMNLVKTLPVSEQSLDVLYQLLLNINPSHASNPDTNPGPMFDRWRNLHGKEADSPVDYISCTGLPFRDEFICLAASLYGQTHIDNEFKVAGRLDDPDQVMRCCFYGHTLLKGKDLQAAFDRDKEVFLFATMQNVSMPTTPEVKVFIEKEMSGRQMIRLYHKRLKQSQERWGREAKPETEWGAELMEDWLPKKSSEELRINALEAHLFGLSKQMTKMSSYLQWILLGAVVLIVLVLRK